MDRLKNIVDLETENRFLEESPQNSPRPQASSTFLLKGNDSNFEKSKDLKSESSTTMFSTTSSLGVIDINKESLFSETDFSSSWSPKQSTPFHQRLVEEYQSQSLNTLKKRLDELSFRNSSFDGTHLISSQSGDTFDIPSNTLEDKIRRSSMAMRLSICSDSERLISSPGFESGEKALEKLEEDQKENRKMFSSLPVSPMNFSINSDCFEEKERKFHEFLPTRCYSPDEISNVLRNRISDAHKEVITRLFEDKSSDKVEDLVTSTTPDARPKTNSTPAISSSPPRPPDGTVHEKIDDEFSLTTSLADISSLNTTFDTSSSIASLNEIAKLLKRQSLLAKPRLAVEELLSLGKSKQKPTSTSLRFSDLKNLDFSSGDTTLVASINSRGKTPSYENILSSTIQNANSNENVQQNGFFIPRQNGNENTQNSAVRNINSNENVRGNDSAAVNENAISNYSNHLNETPRAFSIKLPPHVNAEPVDKTYTQLPRDFVDLTAECDSQNATNGHQFKQNNSLVTAPVQRISSNRSVLNDTTANETDTIFAGNLCVGTLAEVIVVVENPTKEILKYKLSLQSITNDKPSSYPAASVMLASNHEQITFSPQVETEINLMITPLTEGKINITLELVSQDNKCSNITRCIEIIGEMPKLIVHPESGQIQFGCLDENADKTVPLVLQNQASSKLPLKLMLYEDNQTNPSCLQVTLNPFERLDCSVRVSTSHLAFVTNDSLWLQGKLIVLVDTPEGVAVKIPLIRTFVLSANVVRTILRIENEFPLILKSNSFATSVTEYLNVRNVSALPLDIYVDVERFFEFTVEPKYLKLNPQARQTIKINFKPSTMNRSRETNVNLIVKNMNKRIPVKMVGVVEPNGASSPRSHNQSYKSLASSGSSSGSSVAYDGVMELDSTHSSLSWPSVPLNSRKIQTFTLRNRGAYKEKLLLMISDAHNSYKFVENESCDKELKLTLESKESRKISVAFTPTIADQSINGKITIVRRNILESSVVDIHKRVIPLYGIGGGVKIVFSGVFHDNEDRLWINCDSNSFDAKFTIENIGDAEAFVKIVSEELDDRISPEECTLLPSESAEIEYTLNLSTDRLDMLYKQHSHKEVMLVNKLIVYSGNESTRLRLKRIWFKNEDREIIQKIRDKMEILNFNSSSRLRIDSLQDSKTVFTKFLYDGITEHAIGVLVPRQNLENVSLDSTVIFRDLNNCTMENASHC